MLIQLTQFLNSIDTEWFQYINQKYTGSWFDSFMPFMSDFHRAGPFIVIALLIMFYKKRANMIPILLGCVLAVGLSDVTAARIVKPLVQRTRPEFNIKTTRLLVPSQASFSFPSNHAANTFAAATFLLCTFPSMGLVALLVAFIVAYSRVYVGVHYPFDVMGGALLGMICAVIVFKFYLIFFNLADPLRKESIEPHAWKRRIYSKPKS